MRRSGPHRKLSAVSSLFRYLCNAHAALENSVSGVKRPRIANVSDSRTPALSDAQARRRLKLPDGFGLLARRDRAVLAVLLHHGLRRGEVVRLTVRSVHEHRGVAHFRVAGKGSKIRPVPGQPAALAAPNGYPKLAPHRRDRRALLPQPAGPVGHSPMTASIRIVRKYASLVGVPMERIVHALRAAAATNALEHDADIAGVQDWLATGWSYSFGQSEGNGGLNR